jgi:hypothetical protein
MEPDEMVMANGLYDWQEALVVDFCSMEEDKATLTFFRYG